MIVEEGTAPYVGATITWAEAEAARRKATSGKRISAVDKVDA